MKELVEIETKFFVAIRDVIVHHDSPCQGAMETEVVDSQKLGPFDTKEMAQEVLQDHIRPLLEKDYWRKEEIARYSDVELHNAWKGFDRRLSITSEKVELGRQILFPI